MKLETRSEQETFEAGKSLAAKLRAGDVVVLEGGPGAGKTCFAKGIGAGLGVDRPERISSPTFVLLQVYPGRVPLYHYDLFRVPGSELEALGFFDLKDSGVSVIEWGEKVVPGLLGPHVRVGFEIAGPTLRRLTFEAAGGMNLPLPESVKEG